MPSYNSKNNIIFFERDELQRIFELSKKAEMVQAMKDDGYAFSDFFRDRSLMQKLADSLGLRGANDKDEHEVFAALFIFIDFFAPGAQIGFELEGFNSNKDTITTLKDLLKFRKESSDSDFGILQDEGYRAFQMKRYRGKMEASDVAAFIKKKLDHYGGSLGNTNLWVVLQPPAWTESNLDFPDLFAQIQAFQFDYPGHIWISYNNRNIEEVIVQVHPDLRKSTRPRKDFTPVT